MTGERIEWRTVLIVCSRNNTSHLIFQTPWPPRAAWTRWDPSWVYGGEDFYQLWHHALVFRPNMAVVVMNFRHAWFQPSQFLGCGRFSKPKILLEGSNFQSSNVIKRTRSMVSMIVCFNVEYTLLLLHCLQDTRRPMKMHFQRRAPRCHPNKGRGRTSRYNSVRSLSNPLFAFATNVLYRYWDLGQYE